MKPFPAALHATKEIGLAVLATTLSLMAVFLPVAFMSGIVGRFLYSFGLTMAFAIGVSLIVAFSLTPMLAARMLPLPAPEGQERKQLDARARSRRHLSPDRAASTTASSRSACATAGSSSSRSSRTLGVTLPMCGKLGGRLPAAERRGAVRGLSAGAGRHQLEAIDADRRAHRAPGPRAPRGRFDARHRRRWRSAPVNVGSIYVHMTDPDKRKRGQMEVMQDVRKNILPSVPKGVRVAAQPVNDFSIGGSERHGVVRDARARSRQAREVRQARPRARWARCRASSTSTRASSIRSTRSRFASTSIARRCSASTPADITNTLAVLVGGVEASTFEDKGDQYVVCAARRRSSSAMTRALG